MSYKQRLPAMNEKYILSKGDKYACLTFTNRVTKTELLEEATVFSEQEAQSILRRASRKLKGFIIVQVEFPSAEFYGDENEDVEMMVERKVFSMEMRNNVYEKTKGKCALCGKFVRFDLFTIDHIIPLAKGGTNDIENLQCTCKHCNAMKQDLSEKEFLDKMIKILAYQSKKKANRVYKKKIKKLCESL